MRFLKIIAEAFPQVNPQNQSEYKNIIDKFANENGIDNDNISIGDDGMISIFDNGELHEFHIDDLIDTDAATGNKSDPVDNAMMSTLDKSTPTPTSQPTQTSQFKSTNGLSNKDDLYGNTENEDIEKDSISMIRKIKNVNL